MTKPRNTPPPAALPLAAAAMVMTLGACSTMGGSEPNRSADASAVLTPPPPVPFGGAAPDRENGEVLAALDGPLNLRPYHTLTPVEARKQPSFADGVKHVMAARGLPAAPPPGTAERDISVAGAAGQLHAKVVTPSGGQGPKPVIVYFHGGGWVIANSNVYAAGARALAQQTGAIVISVDYRLAPEAKFPAQHDDALASYKWALANAASLGGDPRRIALAGESAGGNLAVATAIAARDGGLQAPLHVLAVYPVATTDLNTPSEQDSANAMPLNRAALGWFVHHTIKGPADAKDPRLNLVAANLRGLPPVTIVAAQIDPLRSDGELLAAALRTAGGQVERREYEGATHEFFGAAPLIPDATAAQAFAAQRLKASFGR